MSAREFGHDLLVRLLTYAMESVPGAIGAGLSLPAPAGESLAPRTLAAVGVAADLDPAQWRHGEGPLWHAFRSGTVVVVPPRPARDDDGHDLPWAEQPDGCELFALPNGDGLPADRVAAVRGAVFAAGEWGGELPVVFSMYFSGPPGEDVLRGIDRHESVLGHALAVAEYCAGQETRAEQMLQMTQHRRVIEQAKGLVMGALEVDGQEAFTTLARASQHFNVRLRNLAVALVEHVGGGTAEQPEDPDLAIVPTTEERAVAEKVWSALGASDVLGQSRSRR